MPHFVMTCEGVYPSAAISTGPRIDSAPWFHGGLVTDLPTEPLVYRLDAQRPGTLKAMYDSMAFPIMRDDLVEALRRAGVDNLQLFRAHIEDSATGVLHTNYQAFNIVGVIAAADMTKSVLMGTSDSTLIDVDFESLALDKSHAALYRVFRLAESVNAIIVDERVKDEVERAGIPGMVFYDPEDWSG